MADPTNTPQSPAPAQSPSPQAAGSAASGLSTDGGANVKPSNSPAPKDEIANPGEAARAARSGTPIGRNSSNLITNPAPAPLDPDVAAAQEKERLKKADPQALPQSTIDEMAAGQKALERNRPVAQALEKARDQSAAGTETRPETNPVDATETLRQQGKV